MFPFYKHYRVSYMYLVAMKDLSQVIDPKDLPKLVYLLLKCTYYLVIINWYDDVLVLLWIRSQVRFLGSMFRVFYISAIGTRFVCILCFFNFFIFFPNRVPYSLYLLIFCSKHKL